MNTQTSASTGGVGLGGLLFVLFLGLKLTHYIDWSWWWVTAPLWAPTVTVLGVAAICGLLWALFMACAALQDPAVTP